MYLFIFAKKKLNLSLCRAVKSISWVSSNKTTFFECTFKIILTRVNYPIGVFWNSVLLTTKVLVVLTSDICCAEEKTINIF